MVHTAVRWAGAIAASRADEPDGEASEYAEAEIMRQVMSLDCEQAQALACAGIFLLDMLASRIANIADDGPGRAAFVLDALLDVDGSARAAEPLPLNAARLLGLDEQP